MSRPMFAIRVILGITVLSLPSFGLASDEAAQGQTSCTISAVSCVGLSTTTTESDVCLVTNVAKIGETDDQQRQIKLTFFVGARLAGEALLIGGARGKHGLLVSCTVPTEKGGKPDYAVLQKELERLLSDRAELKTQYPELKKLSVSLNLKFKPASDEEIRKINGNPFNGPKY